MKTYSVFLQGKDTNGKTQFKHIDYVCEEFNAVEVIKRVEKKFCLSNVQINHYIEKIVKV